VLRHESGLPFFHRAYKLEELTRNGIKCGNASKVIEESVQHFPPEKLGTERDYHACTRGIILNEIFRRVDSQKRTIGEFVREEICGKLDVPSGFVIGATDEEAENQFAQLTGLSAAKVLFSSLFPESIRPHGLEVKMHKMTFGSITFLCR